MGMKYEDQRKYIWEWGWRPYKCKDRGRTVLA